MTDIQKLFWTFAIVMMVGILVWIIETMRMPKAKRQWESIIVITAALLLIGLWVHAARAHDHNRPGLDSWYSALRSGKGPCCGGPKIDATVLIDADWESKDGRYRVRIEGQWYDVPEDAVLSGPNLDGRTLVWPIKGYGGLTIRCFMPGAMT